MGVAIGILLIAGTIASLLAINVRASKMSARRGDDAWIIDQETGHRVRQQDSGYRGGHRGDGPLGGGHHGGGHVGGAGHSGGHFGGFSGGDSGGHHG